jgi:tetratricopeptide (TPR) repeat protein
MKKILCALVLLMCAAPAFAAAGGGYGGDFLKLVGGARSLAMGGAYSAMSSDSSSVYYNPAGLARLTFPEAMVMQNQHFADMKQYLGSFAVPLDQGVIGGGYSALMSGNIEGYDNSGAATSDFDTNSSCFSLAFARKLNQSLSLGIGIKSISEKLEAYNASTVAMDAGVCYELNPNVVFGLSVLNVGSGLTFISEDTPLPTTYRAGVLYRTIVINERVNLAVDAVSDLNGTKFCAGAEYWIKGILALRGGYNGTYPSVGFGLQTGIFEFDYAYLSGDDLGAAHQFSISLLFGAPENKKAMIEEEMADGKTLLDQKEYSKAVIRFGKALDIDPENKEALLLQQQSQLELEIQTRGDALAKLKGKETGAALPVTPVTDKKSEMKEHIEGAMKYVSARQYDKALEEVNSVLSIDPEHQGAKDLKKKLELILKVERK